MNDELRNYGFKDDHPVASFFAEVPSINHNSKQQYKCIFCEFKGHPIKCENKCSLHILADCVGVKEGVRESFADSFLQHFN